MTNIRPLGLPRRSSGTSARDRGRGQGLVEFALVLPVFLLILLMAIDFGRALYGWVVLQNSARIAANFAGLNPDGWQGAGNPTIQLAYEAQIEHDLDTANCVAPGTPPAPVFTDGPDTPVAGGNPDTNYDVGDTVTASLTCAFQPLTPIIGAILGNSVQLGASSEFRIRSGDLVGLADPTRIPLPGSTPTPDPGATPTATPTCTVPNFANVRKNDATTLWTQAGFVAANISFAAGNGNYLIQTQTLPSGQVNGCASTILVGP